MKKFSIILGVLMSIGILGASVIPKHYEKTLKNGLHAVIVPLNNKSGVVEVNVIYKVGSRNEVRGLTGIAHMLEHMNFKSTQNLKAGEFDEIVKKMGGVDNASTSFDYTKYYIKTTAANLDKSLWLFAEVMQNLKFEDSEFQPERDVVMQERLWRTDNNPMGLLYFKFFNTAFEKHSYHWMPIGFEQDIRSWKIEDIKEFHAHFYRPSNAVVLISGDIDKNDAFKLVEKNFAHIPDDINSVNAQTSTKYTLNPDKEPKQNGKKYIEIKKDSQTQYIALGYKIPDYLHKDQVALGALGSILSGGKSSIFERELIESGLTSMAYAYNMELKDDGVFIIMAAANPLVEIKQVEEAILAILQRVKNGEISESQLQKVKINTKKSFILGFESASATNAVFSDFLAKGDLKPLFSYEQDIENLSVSDLQRVAQQYFNDDGLTTAILRK